MPSSVSIPPTPTESIVIDESSSHKPTTLLLRQNRPYYYNAWAENNRLRVKNEQLSKRQQSSCCIAFYSLCLCVIATVTIIVIYRFMDECSSTTDGKQSSSICLRYWLLLAAICTTFLSSSGVIFGACRYFRSQRLYFLYENGYVTDSRNSDGLLPMTGAQHCHRFPRLFGNQTSRGVWYGEDEHSNTTVISSLANTASEYRFPPFNYEELPNESIPIIISVSPPIDTDNNTRCFSSSTSTLSSPQLLSPSARMSNTTNATINSNRSKMTSNLEKLGPSLSVSYSTGLAGVNVWEKQRRLSSLR